MPRVIFYSSAISFPFYYTDVKDIYIYIYIYVTREHKAGKYTAKHNSFSLFINTCITRSRYTWNSRLFNFHAFSRSHFLARALHVTMRVTACSSLIALYVLICRSSRMRRFFQDIAKGKSARLYCTSRTDNVGLNIHIANAR